MANYTNQSKTSSTYSNQTKTPVVATNTYNSSYAYNSLFVTYNGAIGYSAFTNQSRTSSSYSNQSKN